MNDRIKVAKLAEVTLGRMALSKAIGFGAFLELDNATVTCMREALIGEELERRADADLEAARARTHNAIQQALGWKSTPLADLVSVIEAAVAVSSEGPCAWCDRRQVGNLVHLTNAIQKNRATDPRQQKFC